MFREVLAKNVVIFSMDIISIQQYYSTMGHYYKNLLFSVFFFACTRVFICIGKYVMVPAMLEQPFESVAIDIIHVETVTLETITILN